ncbi:flagellar biosynthesis protein FlhA [Xinfangfangia sp. D13-10-4-6]|uniref:flagellar biosynthesis protein FlhA n=1 Tax=Pseudogemmobacter hezensis TaxID=2737662 RepID=UPI001557A27F|nr:flagellar biosynthesis protein FlhA [Pseudogemmobacter hezensis]NPD17503.1 flagellar biosynthesis protein FlhA [Pseudogemmobacter hezensis]
MEKHWYLKLFHPTVALSVVLMLLIGVMVVPIPPFLLDFGLALSFALAILMLTITLFVERPLDFSAFPTILLSSLILRLSLNISSTRLIISDGHNGTAAAGRVIEGFAGFIMGGNIVLGMVVFVVIMIVNFIVITKGAGRMAEVGARFALDGMPGRQLAIDADMSAGAISHEEARGRRESELAETTFFGSLDGASKFVKGDAIAGLLITALNFIVGLSVGIGFHDMDASRAISTYAMLTVGDGLVGQIPAVIISVAAALLLSRGGNKGAVNVNFFGQLGRYPTALATVSVMMMVFSMLPGMPFIPFIGAATALGLCAWKGWKRPVEQAGVPADVAQPAVRQLIGDVLDFDEIHIEFSPNLVDMALDPATGLDGRIASMRKYIAATYGLILPEIRLTDEATLPSGQYRIRIQGVERVTDQLFPDKVLVLMSDDAVVLDGAEVKEPVYGAPAKWIGPELQEDAVLSGLTVVLPAEVLATHLLEVLKASLSRLLSIRGLRRLLDEFTDLSDRSRAEANRRLLDDMIPDKVPMDLLHAVMRLLLDERVSIRNLPLILEAVAEARSLGSAEAVCEHVRQRIGFQIISEFRRPDGTIPLIQLAPEWERTFLAHQTDGDRGIRDVALPPDLFSRLANGIAERLSQAREGGAAPAIVTSAVRRRFLRTVVQARGLRVPVLSYEEISSDTRPALFGQVPI